MGAPGQPPGPEEDYLRDYELGLITESSIDDEVRATLVARIEQLVRDRGGKLLERAVWGRKMLAYPINHKTEGHYAFTRFTGEPSTVAELNRILSISDEVLRFKVVRLPEAALAAGKAPLLKGTAR